VNATIGHDVEIALLALAAVLVYAWHIRRHPWVKCGKCGGGSIERHLGLRPFGACSRCGGSGKRLRFAAWVLGYNKTTGARK
jgi:hypothetical protein